jgi:predicted nucleotidyltransferase
MRVARAVARDLRQLYGERLRDVVLLGSWARGDAHPSYRAWERRGWWVRLRR